MNNSHVLLSYASVATHEVGSGLTYGSQHERVRQMQLAELNHTHQHKTELEAIDVEVRHSYMLHERVDTNFYR
jgi:hypothetical protein